MWQGMGVPLAVLPEAESFMRGQQWPLRDPWEGTPPVLSPLSPLEPPMV